MTHIYAWAFFFLVILGPTTTMANSTEEKKDIILSNPILQNDTILKQHCEITPTIWRPYAAPKIHPTNNLRRKAGSYNFAEGEFIIIQGQILDAQCIPVSQAIVEIWQTNSKGLYQVYDIEENRYEDFDSNFLGSGKQVTDNLGFYNFLTILPGTYGERARHIHFRLRHPNFPTVETIMYFPHEGRNAYDAVLLNEVKSTKRHLLIAESLSTSENNLGPTLYKFDVTLQNRDTYRRY
jgi:protocatechuate 3,4-dioxygenase beta subunit